jgi:hypothetical protein
MKNSLFIDFDSEREDKVRITKPEDMVKAIQDNEGEKQMVIDDLTTCINALGTLIHVAHINDIADKEASSKLCIDYLNETFINKKDNE